MIYTNTTNNNINIYFTVTYLAEYKDVFFIDFCSNLFFKFCRNYQFA